MDVLTDLLRLADPDRRVFAHHAVRGDWGVRFPCERSVGFHVVVQGSCYLRGPGLDGPVRLERGDVVLIARGKPHDLVASPSADAQPLERFLARPALDGDPTTTFVGAAYRFQEEPMHPLFAGLPPLLHLGGGALGAHHPVAATVALLSAEMTDRRPGSGALIESLTDALFTYIVRLWLDRQGPEASSWAAALRDDALARALTAMHHQVERAWEVAELASVSGLSRSAFAERFKRSTGETPGGYLARLRMQRAMVMLRRSEAGIEAIAARVGYASAFALSKAFKRAVGVSPGAYRRATRRPPLSPTASEHAGRETWSGDTSGLPPVLTTTAR